MSYTEEQLNFIKNTIEKNSFEKTTQLYNMKFKSRVTINSIRLVCHRKGWFAKDSRKNSKRIHPQIIHKLADFFYTDYPTMARVIQYHQINDIKFYELVTSEDLIHRRDEFYVF